MILFEENSGWVSSKIKNIKYASIWDKDVFKISGQIKFYPYSLEYVVDATVEGNDLTIYQYPHNLKNAIPVAAQENEERIRKILTEAEAKYGRKVFTIDIGKVPFLLTEDSFTRYMPESVARDELFYINTTEKDRGFPLLFVYQLTQRTNGEQKDSFPVLAMCYDVLKGKSEEATPEGAEFVYTLLNSWIHRTYKPETPHLGGLRFPTSGKDEISTFLSDKSLVNLQALLDKSGVDKVVMKDGKIVYEKEEKKAEKPPVEQTEQEVFGKPDRKSLMMLIMKDVKEKNQINLSDAFTLGFDSVLTMLLGLDQKPVDIFMDISNVARKMCIYEGQIHAILRGNTEQDLVNFLDFTGDSNGEIFHFCSDEDYPKNIEQKLLPEPKIH